MYKLFKFFGIINHMKLFHTLNKIIALIWGFWNGVCYCMITWASPSRSRILPHSRNSWRRSGSRGGNPGRISSKTSLLKTARGKQTLHSLKMRRQRKKQFNQRSCLPTAPSQNKTEQKSQYNTAEWNPQRKMVSQSGWLWWTMATQMVLRATRLSTIR